MTYVKPCSTCSDFGFYLDDGCLQNSCAHGGRTRSPAELKKLRAKAKEGKPASARAKRVMPCPARPCECPAGEGPRQEQRDKIAIQARRLAGLPWNA